MLEHSKDVPMFRRFTHNAKTSHSPDPRGRDSQASEGSAADLPPLSGPTEDQGILHAHHPQFSKQQWQMSLLTSALWLWRLRCSLVTCPSLSGGGTKFRLLCPRGNLFVSPPYSTGSLGKKANWMCLSRKQSGGGTGIWGLHSSTEPVPEVTRKLEHGVGGSALK